MGEKTSSEDCQAHKEHVFESGNARCSKAKDRLRWPASDPAAGGMIYIKDRALRMRKK